jgi:hypothetical protein
MKRLSFAVVSLILVGVIAGFVHRAAHGAPDVCDGFTPAKMLENPELAREYFGAMSDDASAARAHLDALVAELRAVHGCGDAALTSRPALHPRRASPRLPPGHPPVDGLPAVPDFSANEPRTLTI